MKLFVTGATGNVGSAVISALNQLDLGMEVYAGIRNPDDFAKHSSTGATPVVFDFTNPACFENALKYCDILFLLRPPQISDVDKYFKPLIDSCKKSAVKHIVFLSVQGVERSKIIPHHKIEKLIVASEIPYTFLRPAYFMQNFTTTLRKDIIDKSLIYLPAGNALFTIIDVRDIGLVAAKILNRVSLHVNQSYELTNSEKYSFAEMAQVLSVVLGRNIQFKSPNLVRFFLTKRREGLPVMYILVMIMLHYFPRFQREPEVTDWVRRLTDQDPIEFQQFARDHRAELTRK